MCAESQQKSSSTTMAEDDHEDSEEPSSSAEERVYDTVRLDEMEYEEDDATYYYQCPCGDMFELTAVCSGTPAHSRKTMLTRMCHT